MSSRTTGTGYGSGVGRGASSVTASQRKHRSRSTPRYADLEKPKKKKNLSSTTSLVSIPNTIKLSMLNSGLISFDRVTFRPERAEAEPEVQAEAEPEVPVEIVVGRTWHDEDGVSQRDMSSMQH